jgi:serine/threonine protein kinase
MLAPESNLGPYRLIQKIGAGGMGEVWKAEDTRLGRMVAIKILPPAVAADIEAMGRMRREARTAAQLYHPNIATIHSLEHDGERQFIVMELVEGRPLSAVMGHEPMNEGEICRIGRSVAEALAEAHAKGIVHRDIKPDNIIVTNTRVKVLDFGIAKQVGVVPTVPSPDSPTTFMTQQGMIVGTIQYMSPEQALGKSVDARTDIFSLGVVLYEAATGRLPFKGETVTDTMTQIIRDEPKDPQLVNRSLSPGLANIIRRCMAKKREERYESAEQLAAALEGQLGKAATAPYNESTAPTVARTAITPPTVLTRSVPETAPPKKRAVVSPLGVIMLLVAVVGGGAVINYRRQESPAPAPAPATASAPKAPVTASTAPPSTASVNVVAPQPPLPTATHPPPPVPVPQPVAPAPAAPPQPVASDADALYTAAMAKAAEGDVNEARKLLHQVLKQDHHYARAHFRVGEIALLNRNFDTALAELQLALEDSSRLDDREHALTDLGVAVSTRNREESQRIARDINERWPGDLDVRRIVTTFPGMFLGQRPEKAERPRRRFRPN